MSDHPIIVEEARLIILRALRDDPLTSSQSEPALQSYLESNGILRTREWLREQLRRLDDLGAATITRAGSIWIATLSEKGRDHLARRIVVEGIKRPDRGE